MSFKSLKHSKPITVDSSDILLVIILGLSNWDILVCLILKCFWFMKYTPAFVTAVKF